MSTHVPVAVVGGGQAGLSMSWWLSRHGIEHVVLERDRLGHAWREARWDTFCLVTPNWQCQLPGFPYPGGDADGFMVRAEIVGYLEAYAASFGPPLREGVAVSALSRRPDGPFALSTSDGPLTADQVVIATGGYHEPARPRLADRVPAGPVQLDSADYRNPSQLPAGEVLVVGSGQSGAQIAEDLHLAGRTVHLAVGSTPRVARFYRGRDVVAWLDEMGYYDLPVDRHPLGGGVRKNTNHYVTGRDGGRDIDLRAFARDGMRLHGRLLDVTDGRLAFGADLPANLDRADEVSESIKDSIDKHIGATGIPAPVEDRYRPVWTPPPGPSTLDAAGLAAVVWCVGFRADYSWVELPVFDGRGYPAHHRGVTSEPGLYVLGLPWLHTWGSGRFAGVGRDAEHLAGLVRRRAAADAADLAGRPRLAEAS